MGYIQIGSEGESLLIKILHQDEGFNNLSKEEQDVAVRILAGKPKESDPALSANATNIVSRIMEKL